MEDLVSLFNASMLIEDSPDYDEIVRTRPFDFPEQPRFKDINIIEIGYKGRWITVFDDYEGAVTVQSVWIRYCIEYESQLAALMRHLDTVSMDKIDLHEVLRQMQKHPVRPAFLGELTPEEQELRESCGWPRLIEYNWLVWSMKSFHIYMSIAGLVTATIEQADYGMRRLRYDDWDQSVLKGYIRGLVPPRLTREEIDAMEHEVKRELGMIDLEYGISNMDIGR